MSSIRQGDTGHDVQQAQIALNRAKGATVLQPDGIFGPKSRATFRKWQKQNNLIADGIVGPKTWSSLRPYLKDINAQARAILSAYIKTRNNANAWALATQDKQLAATIYQLDGELATVLGATFYEGKNQATRLQGQAIEAGLPVRALFIIAKQALKKVNPANARKVIAQVRRMAATLKKAVTSWTKKQKNVTKNYSGKGITKGGNKVEATIRGNAVVQGGKMVRLLGRVATWAGAGLGIAAAAAVQTVPHLASAAASGMGILAAIVVAALAWKRSK
tara:strand:+ start:151 stop:978 length:828 start_codon:yes stop_codon:yes gene_type:complete